MNEEFLAYIATNGGKIASALVKLAMARARMSTTDPRISNEGASEKTISISTYEGEESINSPTNPPTIASKAQGIATGCIPCAIGHFGTCSGLLNEGMRFARKDGVSSVEVIDRVNMCLDELNAMERVDLRPELISSLPVREKEIANRALNESRQLRHRLEGLVNVDDLERVAAVTQTSRRDIGRDWFNYRQSRLTTEENELSLEEAKKLAAEVAKKEVEAKWHSQ